MRSLKPLLVLGALVVALVVACLLLFENRPAGVDQPAVAEALLASNVPSTAAVGETEPGAPRAAAVPSGREPEPASSDDVLRDRERTIAGRVIDARGEPVGNATVYVAAFERSTGVPLENLDPSQLSWARRAETTTDPTGHFRIALISAGNLRLGVRARGYAPHDRSLSSVDAVHDLGDVVLEESVVLGGRVLDSARRPVAGALVRRLDAEAGSATILSSGLGDVVAKTDEAGAFRIDELGSGPWMLLIRAEGHPDKLERGETSRPGEIVDGLEFVVADAAEIRGRVVRAPPEALRDLWVRAVPVRPTGTDPVYAGALVDEAALLVVPRSARCAADGGFVVRGLTRDAAYRLSGREGEHDLLVSARTTWADVRAGASDVELVYEPPTTILFRAVDAVTSEPVTELTVFVQGAPLAPERDNGTGLQRVRLGASPVRADVPLELTIDARGYEPVLRGDARLVTGLELDLGVIRLVRAPMLTVLVVDGATEKPVARALVTLSTDVRAGREWTRPSGAYTDEAGRAELRNLGAERSLLCVSHADHASFRSTTAIRAGETTVRLSAGGSVVVEVRDALGAVVPTVSIEHVCAGEELDVWQLLLLDESRTDENGQVTFARLSAGAHRFQIAGGGDGAKGEIAVTDGTTQTLVLTVPARGRLSGRVTEGGQPLSGATLRLVQRDVARDALSARTNGQGEYAFHSLELGEYALRVAHPRRAMAFDGDVRVADLQSRFELELPVTGIEGRIVDEEDRPLAGIRLRAETPGSGGTGDARVRSDGDGRYVLSGVLADADVIVFAESTQHQPARSPIVRVSPGQRVSGVDLKLIAGAALDVTIVHADGREAGHCSVRAERDGSGDRQIVRMSADGRGVARLRGLEPGSWRVRVDSGPEGTTAPEQIVEVRLGATNTARLELR